ncbi:hypothetical protein DPX16_7734 [Anabarilius grahami]|uniref:Uncharacterized protein n=1 Tax=Anabarilius grahami TaxID=495550 RepID=A0A3N0XK98_ANAGA|nr:hypothetical protein DPX16_7734 [Anabarilius grahami]
MKTVLCRKWARAVQSFRTRRGSSLIRLEVGWPWGEMSVNWLPFGCCVRLQRAQRWRRRGGARIEVRGESEELRNSFIIFFSPRHASCLLKLLVGMGKKALAVA